MDGFKWKCDKETIDVKENSKRKMKDTKKFYQKQKRKSKRQLIDINVLKLHHYVTLI